jgi:6-phosphogluconolactonase
VGDLPRHVAFVGSYAPPEEQGIHVLTIDTAGALVPEGGVGGIRSPSYVCVHPDGRHLYAVSETGMASDGVAGSVVALEIEEVDDTVALTHLNRRSTGGDHPCHVSVDPSGRWLVAVNYGSGDVVLFPISDDGSLGGATAHVRHTGSGPHTGRQAGPHPHGSAFSPDGRFVLVADLGIDRVVVYALDEGEGTLSGCSGFDARPGAGPRHLAFHPDGEFVFVVNELDTTVTVLAWDSGSGTLHEVHTVSTLPPDAEGTNLAAAVRVSPSGDRVHVSTRGADVVTSYSFDPVRGLERPVVRSAGGRWPRDIGLVAGGLGLLVANEHSDEVVLLPIPGADAPMGRAVRTAAIRRPSAVAVRCPETGLRGQLHPTLTPDDEN